MRLAHFSVAIIASCYAVTPCYAARPGRHAADAYAPQRATCPTSSIVRPASSLATGESQYIAARKTIADAALASWLKKVNETFDTDTSRLPTLGLAGSGGGYRALLNEAGILQAMDARDSNSSVNGLYQAFTYHAALSGGGWLATSLAAWDWPTISYLQKNVYEPNLQDGLLLPGGFYAPLAYAQILADVAAKAAAGYPVTAGDIYGRLLVYNLFPGADGGVALTMSGLTSSINFTEHKVPYPIITSIGTNASSSGDCSAPPDATQYEYTPHEFGSWDKGVNSFVQMAHLGSNISNGTAVHGNCTSGFDNLGFVTASTSNIFGFLCHPVYNSIGAVAQLADALQSAILGVAGTTTSSLFNEIPNPFLAYGHAGAVSSAKLLTLGDGDLSMQNDPVWPFLQPERSVSVLILADTCSENTTNSSCTGLSLHNTFLEAEAQSLTKMPTIPPTSTFVALYLSSQARFFGCHQPDAITIVWLPLVSYSGTTASDISSVDVEVSEANTDSISRNGKLIATQNNDPQWPTCLACAISLKTASSLPAGCGACFARYCVT
ncbi:Lysophospholipase 1 [Friedmanniomyces endolithicus]|nr:Lysophospholipase 1 [Friedmanniomyces endolithicus]